MIKLRAFSILKNFFSRLNPLSSFDLDDINVEIEKVPTSDELLTNAVAKYVNFEKVILIAIYHLINTQNANKEYRTILTKDLRLICDLVEGVEGDVEIPNHVKKEPVNNIFLTCHNHFQKAIIPSSNDFKNAMLPKIKFTIIVSENHIGIIVNELGEKFNNFSKFEKIDFKNNWKSYKEYIMFCLANDCPNEVFKFYNDEYSDEEFQKFFEKYVGENISKFVDEFNIRFKKYNIYYIHIKL